MGISEALCAFHISIAKGSRELSRCSVSVQTVRPLAVVFHAPIVEGSAYIMECTEPARVEAFIAKTSMAAFNMSVLRRSPRQDVNQADLAFFCAAQHAPRCELRSVVGTDTLRLATLLDPPIQCSRDATAGQAGISLQYQALASNPCEGESEASK